MDREEFELAVLRHKDRVHSHAVWVLQGREDSRDVAQEALLRLWVHRSQLRPDTVGSWLLKTTHNLCIDRLRRKTVRHEVDPERLELLEDEDARGPERSLDNADLGKAIAVALATLSPRDRSVVLMREHHGMSYDEIADAVGLPLGTLKSILHRSRERLRRALVTAGVAP